MITPTVVPIAYVRKTVKALEDARLKNRTLVLNYLKFAKSDGLPTLQDAAIAIASNGYPLGDTPKESVGDALRGYQMMFG